jgi:uncharacterized membrane protein YeaQ/YmgE (transglycosylase-associated protein family)
MSIIAWIIFGALAGWIASLIMGTNAQQGALANIIIGIIGALLGGLVVNLLGGGEGFTGFDITGLLIAVLGAVLLIGLIRGVTSRA